MKTSQKEAVLNHLGKGPITPIQALNRYGIFRLASRIEELRNDGHRIYTDMVTRNGKRFAKYSL